MDRICWSKKGQAMVQIFLETSGNALNSNSESIRLLKKLLNWKNSFTGSSKKIDEDISFFQKQKCPVPELSGQDKMNCSKFLLLVTKSEKVLFFCCSQLQERQFCEISVVPIQEQTERVGWFRDSFFTSFLFRLFLPTFAFNQRFRLAAHSTTTPSNHLPPNLK